MFCGQRLRSPCRFEIHVVSGIVYADHGLDRPSLAKWQTKDQREETGSAEWISLKQTVLRSAAN
jgi:hypothetical protein